MGLSTSNLGKMTFPMGERLSFEDIVRRYPNEYVLLNEPESDSQHRVISGEMLDHHPDRRVVADAARRLKPLRCAFFYTGKPPTNVVIAL